MTTITSPIVFLHIPKTAGQAIHNALVAAVGGDEHVSPIRVHTQSADQYPAGYRLYSGHLDWVQIDKAGPDLFSFTVLRDPAERIASFYFYLQQEARKLSASDLRKNLGKRRALEWSADDYFFGGDNAWQAFILDHYNNFYCSYFSTRMMRGHARIAHLKPSELIGSAQSGLESLQGVYLTTDLRALEIDFAARFGVKISVAGKYYNSGPLEASQQRWLKLMERIESDRNRQRLLDFTELDQTLMAQTRTIRATSA